MTILANGRLARVTRWYGAVCVCCEPLLTQRSGITGTKCVRDTMGTRGQGGTASRSWPAARRPLVKVFGRTLAVFCTVLRCVVHMIGTVLFSTKVYTVHVGHCPPVSCMHVIIAIGHFDKSEQY